MQKKKLSYICNNCGYISSKWQGKCSSCQKWNSFEESIQSDSSKNDSIHSHKIFEKNQNMILLDEVVNQENVLLKCPDKELNRVLGEGITEGSLILIGGEPGIGKSTLLLQLLLSFKEFKSLYVTGEESISQVKLRADRIKESQKNCFILNEISLEKIFDCVQNLKPKVIVIDSIQTIFSSSAEVQLNSIAQIKICTSLLMHLAKKNDIAIFVIGHITKEGSIAGPKLLEHMVDVVLQFEGDRHSSYRILRCIKNRFGSTSEIGVYKMIKNGLKQVENPSEIFLSQNKLQSSGITIGVIQEGNRSFLIEVQALVTKSFYGIPQRTAIGFDNKRLSMLIAVLEKKANFKLSDKDIFLNIVGGMKIHDPSLDLSVCIAIISSLLNITIPNNVCFAAEIGLSGELRTVNKASRRVNEASKLGFKSIILSEFIENIQKKHSKIEIKTYESILNITESFKNKIKR